MKNMLLIIDLQNNFINENTKDIPDKIKDYIETNTLDYVCFTKFINELDNNFYNKLNYIGCVEDEDREIVLNTDNYKIFTKKTYTALTKELKEYIKLNNINTIYLCGIDTDACVLKTALDLFDYNLDVKILKDLCMSHSGIDYHNYALILLEKLIGKNNII